MWNPRRKLFISYHHKDEEYRTRFDELFNHLFINKSVCKGEIDTDLSTLYIKRLVQDDYITDASVVVVLVGPRAYCRKNVDWEISAGLSRKIGGRSGACQIRLPYKYLSTLGSAFSPIRKICRRSRASTSSLLLLISRTNITCFSNASRQYPFWRRTLA